jgi:hypothetical protein
MARQAYNHMVPIKYAHLPFRNRGYEKISIHHCHRVTTQLQFIIIIIIIIKLNTRVIEHKFRPTPLTPRNNRIMGALRRRTLHKSKNANTNAS